MLTYGRRPGVAIPKFETWLRKCDELRNRDTSAHFPKFVLHRSTHRHELREVAGYSQTY